MKDLIDHMNLCHEQLQWTADASTQGFLTDSMMADLSECRRLCEQLKDKDRPKSKKMMVHSA